MSHSVQPVILCGGSGARLWPLSRAGFPKQFLCLNGVESLFQQAVQRLAKHGVPPYIVSNEEHRFLAQEQLREIDITMATYLLEPKGRNTAPALTLAALAARDAGTDPVLVVTPADQTVTDVQAFDHALQTAISDAAQGHIVILGVTPDKPETGYGYIQVDHYGEKHNDAAIQSQKVLRFVEKPDLKTAQKYISEGNYFWNAGMFVLKASVWLARMLMNGWKVVYAGNAQCRHSHNYTILEEFRRYFDMGVFHAREPWIRQIFGGAGGEGVRYIVSEIKFLGVKHLFLWPVALLRNVVKLFGYKLGQQEALLPILLLKRKLSMFGRYWKGEFGPRRL